MLSRRRGNLSRKTAQSLLDELLDGPACTVTCKHREVMDVEIAVAVCRRNLVVIYLTEPVVGCDSPAVGEDEAAH